MLDKYSQWYYNDSMSYYPFEISHEQLSSYNKLHFFDKAPINLAASEYGI